MNSQRWNLKGLPDFLLILPDLRRLAYVKNQGESISTHMQTKMYIFVHIYIYQKSMFAVITLLGGNSLKHSSHRENVCVKYLHLHL